VLTITLNPALDITTTVSQLKPGPKQRCSEPRLDPGGGRVNVSRAIKELGGESRALLAIGGSIGDELKALLDRTRIFFDYWPLIEQTRFSFTVMEEATAEHYLPGPHISSAEADAILKHLERLILDCPCYIAASSSLPPGVPADFYARLARRTRELGAKLIIDTHGEPLRLAVAVRPHIIRLNHIEAQELMGGDADGAAHLLARQLIERSLADAIIVTLGDRGAIVATAGNEIEIRPPPVEVRSSVGAGDSFVAALTFGLANGWTTEQAARYGVAAAAAAVTREATELCKRDTVNAFFAQIGGLLLPAA